MRCDRIFCTTSFADTMGTLVPCFGLCWYQENLMAHAAVGFPHKRASTGRAGATVPRPALHLLAGGLPRTTKAEATKLFRKFAERSALPLGKVRVQLIPDSTWKRSQRELGPAASQTIARLQNALAFATRTWQNESDAIDWLLGPHMELGGATPFSLLRTENGGRAVEYVMAALEYGFPA